MPRYCHRNKVLNDINILAFLRTNDDAPFQCHVSKPVSVGVGEIIAERLVGHFAPCCPREAWRACDTHDVTW